MTERPHRHGQSQVAQTLALVDASAGEWDGLGSLLAAEVAVWSRTEEEHGYGHAQTEEAGDGHGWLDPACLRFHDLQRKVLESVPERRLSFALVNDYAGPYEDVRDGDAPFGQTELWSALNRSSRERDLAGREALPGSHRKVVDSEDGRYAIALTAFGPDATPPEEQLPPDVTDDAGGGLPPGISFFSAGTTSGTGGTVVRALPGVAIGGVTFFGQAAVNAAQAALDQGGSAADAARWAKAATSGTKPPPLLDAAPGASGATRPRPPELTADPEGVPWAADRPSGYVWDGESIGLLGTLVAPRWSAGVDPLWRGKEGTPGGILPLRYDAQFAWGPELRGALSLKPAAELEEVQEGTLFRGHLYPDATLANTNTALGHETVKWVVGVRVTADLQPGTPPPPEQPPPNGEKQDEEEPEEEGEAGGGHSEDVPGGGGGPPPPVEGPGTDSGQPPQQPEPEQPQRDPDEPGTQGSQARNYDGPGEPCPNQTGGTPLEQPKLIGFDENGDPIYSDDPVYGDNPVATAGTGVKNQLGALASYTSRGRGLTTQVGGATVVNYGHAAVTPVGGALAFGGRAPVLADERSGLDGLQLGLQGGQLRPGLLGFGPPGKDPGDDRDFNPQSPDVTDGVVNRKADQKANQPKRPDDRNFDPNSGAGSQRSFEQTLRDLSKKDEINAQIKKNNASGDAQIKDIDAEIQKLTDGHKLNRKEQDRIEQLKRQRDRIQKQQQAQNRNLERLKDRIDKKVKDRQDREQRQKDYKDRKRQEHKDREQRKRDRQREQREEREEREREERRRKADENRRAGGPKRPRTLPPWKPPGLPQGTYLIDTTPSTQNTAGGSGGPGGPGGGPGPQGGGGGGAEPPETTTRPTGRQLFGTFNVANYGIRQMGLPGAPATAEGQIRALTFAVQALQRTVTGAFGGPSYLAGTIAVQHRNYPGQVPTGSRIGHHYTAGPNEQLLVRGAPALEAFSQLESAGGRVEAGGGGVFGIVRSHVGSNVIDTRPALLIENGRGQANGIFRGGDMIADVRRRFAVAGGAQVISSAVQIQQIAGEDQGQDLFVAGPVRPTTRTLVGNPYVSIAAGGLLGAYQGVSLFEGGALTQYPAGTTATGISSTYTDDGTLIVQETSGLITPTIQFEGNVQINGTISATGKASFDDEIDPIDIVFEPQDADPVAGGGAGRYGIWVSDGTEAGTVNEGLYYSRDGVNVRLDDGGGAASVVELFQENTEASTSSSTETDLIDYPLPADTVAAEHEYVMIEASGISSSSGGSGNIAVRLKLGGTEVSSFTLTTTGISRFWTLRAKISRAGSTTTGDAEVTWSASDGAVDQFDATRSFIRHYDLSALTGWDADQTIKLTGQVGASVTSGGITQYNMSVTLHRM